MIDWDEVFRELADEPADFSREQRVVYLQRHGEEYVINLREVPGIGLAVQSEEQQDVYTPISVFVQRDLLGLGKLAKQVNRALEKELSRQAFFIEGPSQYRVDRKRLEWQRTASELQRVLCEADFGSTRIIQLMALAGQGKTFLLEHVARDLSRVYKPDSHPTPILLPVDVLGRYVGTVDDAIAGALNNTYKIPGLSQSDVNLCVRLRWLILALDGFDELVARVGTRDAFLRITELLEQLRGSGTIILSARETFFELFQITTAIRSYLQPKNGSYSMASLKLLSWTDEQGLSVFQSLGSQIPEKDWDGLLNAFDRDRDIVLHPFFLTRLAELWLRGERFVAGGKERSGLLRTKYVIDTYIERETSDKWRSRDGVPLLSVEQHTVMLSSIAEEMWRSGSFKLGADELQVAAEIGLNEAGISQETLAAVIPRVPTHAAFVPRERGFAFLHDRFMYFYLGFRLATLLSRQDKDNLRFIFLAKEFAPQIIDWADWSLRERNVNVAHTIRLLNDMAEKSLEGFAAANLAALCAKLVQCEFDQRVEVRNQKFGSDAFMGRQVHGAVFRNCDFWNVDLRRARFAACSFVECNFGAMFINNATRFDGSKFKDCVVSSVELENGWTVFSPEDISKMLSAAGAEQPSALNSAGKEARRVPVIRSEAAHCVQRFVKYSERTCDVAIEEMESEGCGHYANTVARVGLDTGVLREIAKQVAGPRRRFVRFDVDRQKLMLGQEARTGDTIIDEFWDELTRRFPARS